MTGHFAAVQRLLIYMKPEVLGIASAAVSLFFAVLFIQSGLDKVVDRNGNLDWLKRHFAKSPLAGMVPLLLLVMTAVECTAGVCCLIGVLGSFVSALGIFPSVGLLLAMLALLMLFFGQRVAKDYAGAATLATYFAVAFLGYLVCSFPR